MSKTNKTLSWLEKFWLFIDGARCGHCYERLDDGYCHSCEEHYDHPSNWESGEPLAGYACPCCHAHTVHDLCVNGLVGSACKTCGAIGGTLLPGHLVSGGVTYAGYWNDCGGFQRSLDNAVAHSSTLGYANWITPAARQQQLDAEYL